MTNSPETWRLLDMFGKIGPSKTIQNHGFVIFLLGNDENTMVWCFRKSIQKYLQVPTIAFLCAMADPGGVPVI